MAIVYLGCPYILNIGFKLMLAGTACAIIKVAHMQIFRAISQYLTDCTTLLLSHGDYNGENVENLKVAQKIYSI